MAERMVKLETKLAQLQSLIKTLQERAELGANATDAMRDLDHKLNGYIRLYADAQSEAEKLRLDVRRLEQALETEKAMVENRLGKEVRRVKAALADAEEANAELLTENNRLKEFFLQAQQQKPASANSQFGGFVDLKRVNDELSAENARLQALVQHLQQQLGMHVGVCVCVYVRVYICVCVFPQVPTESLKCLHYVLLVCIVADC